MITGASRGIGRAIAEKLAGKDVELLLHGRDTVARAQTRKAVEPQCGIGVNITAPFLLTQRFAPRMPPGSSVVNILSVAAKTAFPNWSAYCMSKFALEGFSRCVREELRDRKIRVINVHPAATDTDIWSGVEGQWPRERMMNAMQVADAVAFALARPKDTLVGEHHAFEFDWKSVIDHATLASGKRCSHGSMSRVRKNAALPETTGRRPVATAPKVLIP